MANVNEKKITIPEGSNAMAVDLADHSFVAILRNGREVLVDSGGANSHRFALPPGEYVVRTDGKLSDAKASKVDLDTTNPFEMMRAAANAGSLQLSAAAPHTHPVDHVGQLPADGTSACTITVQRLNAEGRVMTDAEDELYLRATGGSLRNNAGQPIARVQLKAGLASFQLVAEAAPRFITVTVFGALAPLRTELPFEFVPPSELQRPQRPAPLPPRPPEAPVERVAPLLKQQRKARAPSRGGKQDT